MKLETQSGWRDANADVVVVPVVEGEQSCAGPFEAQAAQLFRSGDLPLKANDTLLVPGEPRTLYVGVAKHGRPDAWMHAAATAVRRAKKAVKVAMVTRNVAAAAEGAVLASFLTESYKTGKNGTQVETVAILGAAEADIQRGRIIGESINWARQLINEPSNIKPPRVMAERAAAMAAETGLECDVLDETRIRALGMGALIGVAQGSAEPPRMVVLKHTGAQASSRKLCLVGKGVTFDTGGISIKPADGMEKMKYDMAGGASVMAAMRALKLLNAPVDVMSVVPLAENMPGGRAQRPGDVLRSLSGKTIEVINTDAEGRVILADGLAYAKQLGATHLIDMATLTGAIRVALGPHRVGLFGNDQPFVNAFLAAAERTGERMWQLPLDDEYRDMIKSSIADVANSGGRFAGAITAAKFLQEFVGDTPWIHLDVAGIAWNEEEKPFLPKGPSGIAIRTLIEFAATF